MKSVMHDLKGLQRVRGRAGSPERAVWKQSIAGKQYYKTREQDKKD